MFYLNTAKLNISFGPSAKSQSLQHIWGEISYVILWNFVFCLVWLQPSPSALKLSKIGSSKQRRNLKLLSYWAGSRKIIHYLMTFAVNPSFCKGLTSKIAYWFGDCDFDLCGCIARLQRSSNKPQTHQNKHSQSSS